MLLCCVRLLCRSMAATGPGVQAPSGVWLLLRQAQAGVWLPLVHKVTERLIAVVLPRVLQSCCRNQAFISAPPPHMHKQTNLKDAPYPDPSQALPD